MGFALKPNVPKICAYADNIGFIRDVRKRFIVISVCFTIQHHKLNGKLLSTDARPSIKLFLGLRIARSAAFSLWIYSGDNCTIGFLF